MSVNGIWKAGSYIGKCVSQAKPTSVLDDLAKIDDVFLDNIIKAQQKAKVGIYASRPWGGTPREWQEVGTKLAYNDLRKQKISSLAARYSMEPTTLKVNGSPKEFMVFKGSKSGSNEGYWALLKGTDDLYYIKYGSAAQIRSEQLAGELYELGGIPSTKKMLVSYTIPPKNAWSSETERLGVATKFMPINGMPDSNDVKIVREGFGMDCWLANWDALKDGNVVMSAGNAARLDVGGSLCYRARGGRKGIDFGENVGELTSFFNGYSQSRPYLANMTREELIQSLERVTSIPDKKIIDTINKAAQYKSIPGGIDPTTGKLSYSLTHVENTGVKNPEYLKEVLIARKNYLNTFKEKCLWTPQMPGETIEQYIRRLDSTMPKKTYNVPFEKIEMSTEITDGVKGISMAERLTPSQKKLYEESYQAYNISAKNKILATTTTGNILSENSMLHATSYKNLEDILSKGVTTGDVRGSIGTGTGCATQTPLCADFWDVTGKYTIQEYFSRPRYNPGEANFLPRLSIGGLSSTRSSVVVVVDKNRVAPTLMKNSFNVTKGEAGSILYKDGNMAGHSNYITHRAVPIGVPANTIEKIIIPTKTYTQKEIQQIKDMISAKGLNIQVYDLNGNLL